MQVLQAQLQVQDQSSCQRQGTVCCPVMQKPGPSSGQTGQICGSVFDANNDQPGEGHQAQACLTALLVPCLEECDPKFPFQWPFTEGARKTLINKA